MSVATYQYCAVDKGGSRTRGEVKALTEQDAFRKLSMQGLTPIRLRVSRRRGRAGRAKVSRQEIAHFTYQFAVLLEARIPIADGLLSIAEQETKLAFQALLNDVAASIQAGATITESLEPHRSVFGDIYISTIHAAEKSGNMVAVLEELADMLEKQAESVKQVRGALTYPIVVMIALSAATLFLLVFVVPRFAEMFAKRGVELPLLTRVLQAFGLSVRQWWWLYGAGILGAVFGARAAWRSAQGRTIIDQILHRTPVLRSVLVGLAVGRFARVFGVCLKSGLGLLESLDLAGRSTGRPLLQRDANRLMSQVRGGNRLTEALRDCGYLPPFAKRMIAAGEESAELPRLCRVVSRHYEREVGHLVKNMATIMEPLLIAVMTVVVLIVALAVFLPMWDMVGLVG